ncbi:septal ring lytic transglycosylase RlpA family protein [Euzebya tangerina]|uniref:septal ring lytic transglycosylase RlpA family protein n=1 Tax=Euzebya tangerina TaxID=591198 RepID=UPI000E323315|nr:septal ring lytic transglycosylase RlpA family protein [Euzebya tangerina]
MPLSLKRAATSLLVAVLVVSLSPTLASADSVVSRAAGNDRIQTAVEASQQFRSQASDVVLATAFSFPDALAASALTHALHAPLLLTATDSLPVAVEAELARLQADRVWILGGVNAVSDAVEQRLRTLGYDINRLAGASRFETAQAIAVAAGPSRTGEVVLALGEHPNPDRAWPDAVASGSLAATPDRIPTLLTQPDALPSATVGALAQLSASEVIILGNAQTISDQVEDQLRGLGYQTRRIVESSRYDTSVALAAESLRRFDGSPRPAVFASGRAFPDALSAGSLAASLGAPLLLVPPTDQLPATSETFLRSNAHVLSSGVVVGGPVAADDFVVAQLDSALQNEPGPLSAPPEPLGPPEEPEPAPSSAPAPDPISPPGPTQPDVGDGSPVEVIHGVASWYGPGFEGRPTANGETFDPAEFTAAHRTLPFNSLIRVTNLDNGEVVNLRINDRGPFSGDRVLDVSSAAADELRMKDDGVATVRIEVMRSGS